MTKNNIRRNFTLLFMDITFFNGGHAYIDSSTILPVFLSTLTGSPLIIGAITAIKTAGVFLPQLWSAHYLAGKKLHIGYLVRIAAVSRIALALFALCLYLSGPADKAIMLACFIVAYTLFWSSEGFLQVSWFDLVAKAIPERMRGSLFGWTQVSGGILMILAGLISSRVLSSEGPSYPHNYAAIMAIAAALMSTSWLCISRVREPEGVEETVRDSFAQYLKHIIRMTIAHRELRRLIEVQILMGFFTASLPFYILAAKASSRITSVDVGGLLAVQVIGTMAWSALAGWASDRFGPKIAIIMNVLAGLIAASIALLWIHPSIWILRLIFFVVGGMNGTTWLGVTNYVLEMAKPEERKDFVGMLNTANAPTVIFPVVGGLIAQVASFRAVFAATAAVMFICLLLSLTLHSRRTRRVIANNAP